IPVCKDCDVSLRFDGYASMGGNHSNYYKCPKCERVVTIYDYDLPHIEVKAPTKKF
ncbi:hypothetical protein LCGC14_2806350, partial [marine sediment metagenome]